jgi:hypothetical protein
MLVALINSGNSDGAVCGCAAGDCFHAGYRRWRGVAWRGQGRDPVKQAVPAIDEEAVVRKEIHPDDGQLDIRHHEALCEVVAQAQVEAT